MLLVEPDSSPGRTIYFAAALVVKVLKSGELDTVDLATLARAVQREDKAMPVGMIVPALDFLFLLGLVGLNDDGALQCF